MWLATVAHVRHQHTEYEKLLEEGYDRDAARFLTSASVVAPGAAPRPLTMSDGHFRLSGEGDLTAFGVAVLPVALIHAWGAS